MSLTHDSNQVYEPWYLGGATNSVNNALIRFHPRDYRCTAWFMLDQIRNQNVSFLMTQLISFKMNPSRFLFDKCNMYYQVHSIRLDDLAGSNVPGNTCVDGPI